MSNLNKIKVEVVPGQPCEPPMQGLRWVEVRMTLPVNRLITEGEPVPTTPGMFEEVTVKCGIPAIAKGANIEAAAYGYGRMALATALAQMEALQREHRVNPELDRE